MYSSHRLQVDSPTPSSTGSSAVTEEISSLPCARAASSSRTPMGAWRWFVPTRTTATGRSVIAPLQQGDDLVQLPLQPAQLRLEDGDVGDRHHPGHAVHGGDVLDVGLVDHRAAPARRRIRRTRSSRRLPRISTQYIAPARASIAASETRKVANMLPSMFAPFELNVIGWISSCDTRTASTDTG